MPKLLFLVTEDWYFHSHRLALGRAARAAGFEVVLVTRPGARTAEIEAAGVRVRPIGWRRRGFAPVRELGALIRIWSIYREERPDIVHHVALKAVLYGALAARLAPVGAVVNAIAGLGFAFASSRPRARVLRPPLRALLGWLLDRPRWQVMVQNPDDRAMVLALGVAPRRVVLVRGSGVDERRFVPTPEPGSGPLVAVVVARMLWDKGIAEVVEASRLLKARGARVTVRLVGAAGDDNPASIPARVLEGWAAQGLVEWWGHVDDVPAIWAHAHIAVLASYREGLPRSLLEAAAAGRPLVATDVPGCREVVRPGVNGLLVPVRDPAALADAIETLAADAGRRERFGAAARRLVEACFTERAAIEATLALYDRMLKEGATGG